MSNLIQISKPEPPSIIQELNPLVAGAEVFVIDTMERHGMALEREKALRDGEKQITSYFEDARKAADQAKKEILKLRDGPVGALAAARAIYKRKALAYEDEQARKAREEEARLGEIARKQEEDRILEAAIQADAAGETEMAEAMLEEPVTAPVVIVKPEVAKVAGVVRSVRWKAEVTSLMALVQYVAENPQWIELLEPNQVAINRLAVTMHDSLRVPGITFSSVRS